MNFLKKYRGVIFDVDGTLVDSNEQHARAFAEAFKILGYKVSLETVRPLIGMGSEKLIPAALKKPVSPENMDEIGECKSKIFKEKYLSTVVAFPKVKELIEHLDAQGLSLAIGTSASQDELKDLLAIAGVESFFSAVATADDADHSKPDPDIILAACKKIELPKKDLVMVGDTPYDVSAAQSAGIDCIAFLCGGWDEFELNAADGIYQDASGLLDSLSKG